MRSAAALLPLLALTALSIPFGACKSPTPLQVEARWRTPRKGAVVSEHPLATGIGLKILDQGGNATDAAVATALALAVVYPQAGNLGGGGFALWVPHVGEARAFDFRETAPAAASPERYLGPDGHRVDARSLTGPLAVAIPGTPRGLYELWRTSGSKRLGFEDLARPAIELARQGFQVDAWLARDLASEATRERMNAAAREIFYPGGRALREGEVLRQPDLAQTLALYAGQGPGAIYSGRVAEAIVAEISAAPIPDDPRTSDAASAKWMTLADLAGYKIRERAPLRGWFRGMELVTMPPPSSGGIVLLQALGILEGMPLDAQKNRAAEEHAIERGKGGAPGADSPFLDERMAHWWIEALRRAFADRAEHMGDPDFAAVPTRELLSPEWIARRRVSIGDNADPSVPAYRPPHEGGETTHLSVLDQDGNAVSLTTTINSFFGSGILVRGAGFFLNDEMDDFSIQPGSPNQFGLVGGAANALAPGKRPLSSMTPTVVRDGGHANVIVLGSPGGPKIITAVLQVVLRVLVLEQTMPDAVAAPRLHQQWSPSGTSFETGFDHGIVSALANRRGHQVEVVPGNFASVQAIWLPGVGGVPIAVSDPRRGGAAGVQGQPISIPSRPPPPGLP
jgi:gamma-glutamyltranspeptidase/glutathione hydrolase